MEEDGSGEAAGGCGKSISRLSLLFSCFVLWRRAQVHDETFRRTSGFEEFTQIDLDYVERFGLQLFSQFPADLVEDDGLVDVDCVAGETQGVGF
jgi:hypothetical protein